jgi:flagellar biosynthetic protein FliR
MGDLSAFSAAAFWAFLQVFARVSALFVSAPVFGSPEIPPQVKIGLSAILSLVLLPQVKPALDNAVPGNLSGMVGTLIGQVIIGLLIGFVVSLLFAAVRVGGSLIDYQMGFTQAATFNPQFNESISPIADFQYRYALVLYLIANGHWLLLFALERSFAALPVAHLSLGGSAVAAYTDLTYQLLIIGLQIAAPGAAVLLITDIALAFLNRALPQVQVFALGMPLKIAVGLVMVAAVLPMFTYLVTEAVGNTPAALSTMLRGLHHA